MDMFEEHAAFPGTFVQKRGHGVQISIFHVSEVLNGFKAHELSPKSKAYLLNLEAESNKYKGKNQALINRMLVIDPTVAGSFAVKEFALTHLRFRLLVPSKADPSSIKSYIALSYSCHNDSWNPSQACTDLLQGVCPTSRQMMTALVAELRPNEGLWIDQICIAQKDLVEKDFAIKSMDVVYRSARTIIIILEDIQLDRGEALAIKDFDKHGHKDLSESNKQLISKAFETIFSSRWFTRAWCDHEFLVSQHCIFLIGIEQLGDEFTVLKVDGAVMSELGRIAIKYRSRQVQPSDGQTELDNIFPKSNWRHMMRTIEQIDANLLSAVLQTTTTRHNGSYMHTFSRVFELGATFVKDKASIVMNIMSGGLTLSGEIPDNAQECYRRILVMSLASGDPTSLATTGKALDEASWLRMPAGGDDIRPDHVMQFPATKFDISIKSGLLKLHTVCIGTSVAIQYPSPSSLMLAAWILKYRKQWRGRHWDWITQLDQYEDEVDLYKAMEAFYIETLASAICMGEDWIMATSILLQEVVPAPLRTYTVESVPDTELQIALESLPTIQPDEPGISNFRLGLFHPLLAFLEVLVVVGLGMGTEEKEKMEFWRDRKPGMLTLEAKAGEVLCVVPKTWEADFRMVVPLDIVLDQYSWMSRVWFLTKSGEKHDRLLCKTRLAGKHSLEGFNAEHTIIC